MPDNGIFEQLDALGGDPIAAFDLIAHRALAEKNYPLLFETRLMRRRYELALPLVQTEAAASWPEDKQSAYEEAARAAAREAGRLYLDEGNIPRAWPYYRAIGDQSSVKSAIEAYQPGEGIEEVIQIAFQEGVHPVKGLQLILNQYGMCRAITTLGMYALPSGRADCIGLLVRGLHREIADAIVRTIEGREGAAPDGKLTELIRDRDWLFGEYDYYADTSHVSSVVRYSIELTDPESLALAHDLCEYGMKLSSNFQFRGDPPFEDVFRDCGLYLRALLRRDDDAVAHLRRKSEETREAYEGILYAQALINLLTTLGRYGEAADVSVDFLSDVSPAELSCPSALQLCHMAGDYAKLRDLARERGDALSYAAALTAQSKG